MIEPTRQDMDREMAAFRMRLQAQDERHADAVMRAEERRMSVPLVRVSEIKTEPRRFTNIQDESLPLLPSAKTLAPTPCCLYPWPFGNDPADGDSPLLLSDLPQELTATVAYADASQNVTLTLDPNPRPGYGGPIYKGTGSPINAPNGTPLWDGNIQVYVAATGTFGDNSSQEFVWVAVLSPQFGFFASGQQGGSGNYDQCLVDAYAFRSAPGGNRGATVVVSDQFTRTYTVDGTDKITRVAANPGSPVGSCQWSGSKAGGGMWTLDYGLTTPYKWHLASYGGSGSTAADKTDPQDGPAGTYGSQSISA